MSLDKALKNKVRTLKVKSTPSSEYTHSFHKKNKTENERGEHQSNYKYIPNSRKIEK